MAMTLKEFGEKWPQIKKEILEEMCKGFKICPGCTKKQHMESIAAGEVSYPLGKRRVCSDRYYSEFDKEIARQGGYLGVPHRIPHGC